MKNFEGVQSTFRIPAHTVTISIRNQQLPFGRFSLNCHCSLLPNCFCNDYFNCNLILRYLKYLFAFFFVVFLLLLSRKLLALLNISIYFLRNNIPLFWISWWSRIFTTKGERNCEDDCAKDTCFLLPVITLAERDNYAFRSFAVSWASRTKYLCELGDDFWIFWILQEGLNWGRNGKDWVAQILILKFNLPWATKSSPWFPYLYSVNNRIHLTWGVGK